MAMLQKKFVSNWLISFNRKIGGCMAIACILYNCTDAAYLKGHRSKRQDNCCGNLGCFDLTAAFIDLFKRPINLFPSCNTKVEFTLRTQDNVDNLEKLNYSDIDSIKKSNYRADREGTKFIIHGFIDNGENKWISVMERKLLVEGDFNVIRVHWDSGSLLTYFQAAANSRVVGSITAKLIRLLNELGQDYATVHLIGHSLGAHIAGYAGEQVKIGRITGLDPAGLYFKDMPPSVRLDPTDADLVDTIITDGRDILKLGYGALQAMGHFNFFPNGGINQPGCARNLLTSLFKFENSDFAGTDVLGCSHFRAPLLFSDTVASPLSNCLAVECDSYENYKMGKCFSCNSRSCISMGLNMGKNATKASGQTKSFFLDTDTGSPYCGTSFRIVFGLADEQSLSGNGFLRFRFHGARKSSDWVEPVSESVDLAPGRSYTFIILAPSNIGPLKAVSITWKYERSLLHVFDYLRTYKIKIKESMEVQPLNGSHINRTIYHVRILERYFCGTYVALY
ncbi:pancreatic lipase-related protein 2-like isoform X2 [Paramacrobiotus metropolitanus]|uniref:pancreatic lipase-related protein 2-like isoform X2 n=1 Tax=Paramacrobiotus metropolitanus TaxID=2943436 RepID=UPI002445A78C|nr:pancreatic lipase-related protein 2-like isoform X2 [Paramacrobiotus metropolitanus]